MFGAGASAMALLLWVAGYAPGIVVVGAVAGWVAGMALWWVLDAVERHRQHRARLATLAAHEDAVRLMMRVAGGR